LLDGSSPVEPALAGDDHALGDVAEDGVGSTSERTPCARATRAFALLPDQLAAQEQTEIVLQDLDDVRGQAAVGLASEVGNVHRDATTGLELARAVQTLGDIYNNGRGRARPNGVARNTLEGAGFASVDLRVSRELKIGGNGGGSDGRAITLGFDAFNLLNRVNYGTYVGTFGSPLFRQPVAARAARQLQLSARVKF